MHMQGGCFWQSTIDTSTSIALILVASQAKQS